jgi:SNF2 family DNA or RNA helicase
MLVVEQAKSIALKLNNPQRVLECIPSAKILKVRGMDMTIVPHGHDEVRVLRNLGLMAPAPIMHYYGWPGQFVPYAHQKSTAAFLTMHSKALVLNEIGTGKTQSALWAADYLISIGAINKVLVISPLSTLERVWGDAIFKGFPHRRHVTLYGDRAKRKRLIKSEADFYIVNHDGFTVVADEANGMFDLIIVDEAAVYRTPSTTRFKLFRRWMGNNPDARLWLMTGTPTPNNPTDAWALAQLVGNPNTPKTYGSFRDLVMERYGQYTYVPRPSALDNVKHILQPAVRFKRDDCFELPPLIYQTRSVALTDEQRKHYGKMMKSFITGTDAGGQITAVNEAVKLQKLIQISCGVAYDDMGNNVEIDCAPRIKALIEVIEEAGGKVLVFVPLTGTLHMLEQALSKRYTVGVVNGAVTSKKRDVIFQNFQEAVDPRIILAHPGTMAHGLTMTAASTIIWYGPITSNEQYVQANGRVERIGKKHASNVVHIEATELEHKMYTRLRTKQRLQGLLLDLIQQEQEKQKG